MLYNTAHLPVTDSLYYSDHKQYEFKAKIVEVIHNAKTHVPDIVVLDQSSFYPTSGGQVRDCDCASECQGVPGSIPMWSVYVAWP